MSAFPSGPWAWVGRFADLTDQGRDDLGIGGDQAVAGGRALILDHRVDLRQPVVGHHREHVVFDVVVHVEVQEPEHRVEINGARVQAVVVDVLVHRRMLGQVEQLAQDAAVEARAHDIHQRQDRVQPEAAADDGCDDQQIHAAGPDHRAAFGLGDEVLAVLGQVARRVAEQALELVVAVPEEEDVRREAQKEGRARRDDFRILADDEGVGVVPRMAPAVVMRLAQSHEGAEPVEDLVDPAGPERRAVTELVVTVVRRRIEDAVGKERRHRPPGAPVTQPA
jgi:hypothetical protein